MQIVQKEFPFFPFPDFPAAMAIETDSKGGDQIEATAYFRQWFERLDPPNNAFQAEQREKFAIELGLRKIESENPVPELF